MRIGILGSGLMGGKLGTLFARTGHEVVFSYARSIRKAQQTCQRCDRKCAGGNAARSRAGRGCSSACRALVAHRRCVASGRRPVGQGDRKLLASDECRQYRPHHRPHVFRCRGPCKEISRARVVCAFNTVPSEVLFCVFEGRRRTSKPSLVYCGMISRSKRIAAELIRDVGFDPVPNSRKRSSASSATSKPSNPLRHSHTSSGHS